MSCRRWAIQWRESGIYWGDRASNPRFFTSRADARAYREVIDPTKRLTHVLRVEVEVFEYY